MKIAIFYFSGTGNTYFMSKKLKNAFEASHHCDVYAIENHLEDANAIIDDYDLIGLGYPVYGSSLPDIVFAFIDSLQYHSKSAFTFCTQMMYSGDGAAYGGRVLGKKGFIVRWQEHVNMPNNITDVSFLTRKKPYNYEKIERYVTKKAEIFAKRILSGKPYKKGSNPLSLILGLVQRVPYEAMEKDVLSCHILIDHEVCTRCGLCVKGCPTHHLYLGETKIEQLKSCTLCYRCINHCPVQAMSLSTKQKVKYPYLGPSKDFEVDDLKKDLISKTNQ
jgi:ferredoxin